MVAVLTRITTAPNSLTIVMITMRNVAFDSDSDHYCYPYDCDGWRKKMIRRRPANNRCHEYGGFSVSDDIFMAAGRAAV